MIESKLQGKRTNWKEREACVLGNDLVQVTHLIHGGHIVDFHFHEMPSANPLWIPQWKTQEPSQYRPARDARAFGSPESGKQLSSAAGHLLCLDHFGPPSAEEAQLGAVQHGQAGVRTWKASIVRKTNSRVLRFSVPLPDSGLIFRRELTLNKGESVVAIRETVKNERRIDQYIQWQQHATLGPPFLDHESCTLELPGARGLTIPGGYAGAELLASAAEFTWPFAPQVNGDQADLRRVLITEGKGFVAGVQITPNRDHGFVCVVNKKESLAFGYCFARTDFPWVALWEENRARSEPPWNGREQTRGLEFGTTPLPLSREETYAAGALFGTPTLMRIPAMKSRTVNYVMFLARVPQKVSSVSDVVVDKETLHLLDSTGGSISSLSAAGLDKFFHVQ